MIVVSFQNSSGEMDRRIVRTPAEVMDAIQAMIGNLSDFYTGDKVTFTNIAELGGEDRIAIYRPDRL